MTVSGAPESSKAGTSRLWRILGGLTSLVWMTTITLLVLVALYVALGRQLIRLADDYRPELEAMLSAQLGQPVRIDALEGRWQGLDPILEISGLSLGEGKDAPLNVRRLRLRLDSLVSLVRWRLVLREFQVRHVQARLRQTPEGRFGMPGLWMPAPDAPPFSLDQVFTAPGQADLGRMLADLGRLLSDPAIEAVDVRVEMTTASGESRGYQIPSLALLFRQGLFRAGGRLMDVGASTELARFALRGQHLLSEGFDGRIYAELTAPRRLDPFLGPYRWDHLGLSGLDIRGEIWLDWREGRVHRAIAQLRAPLLQLHADNQELPALTGLKANFGWRRGIDAGQWRLDAQNLQFAWQGEPVAPFSLILGVSGEEVAVRGSRLEVGPLAAIMQACGVLPAEALASLRDYQPHGQVAPFDLRVPADGPFRLEANLRDIGIQPFDGVPGAEGLSGYLSMTGSRGKVRIDARDMELYFADLFTEAWPFQRLTGDVSWRPENRGWRVESHNLHGKLADGMRLSGAFGLITGEAVEDWLAMRVGVAGGDAARLDTYMPKKTMDEGVYNWINQAITGGRIEWGWYYGYGGVDNDYPLSSYSSGLRYRFSDLDLQYDAAWPPLVSAAGEIAMVDEQAWITLDSGTLAGLPLQDTRVAVVQDEGNIRVDVDTRIETTEGPLQEALARLPGPNRAGLLAPRDFSFSGPIDASIHYSLYPIADRPSRLRVDSRVGPGHLVYEPHDLHWQEFAGRIRYDSRTGLSSEGLSARFLSRPVTLDLSGNGADSPFTLTQAGVVTSGDLARQLGTELTGMSGQLPYQAKLILDEPLTLRLESSTLGLQVGWPAPFGKASGSRRDLELKLEWPDGESTHVTGEWGKRLHLRGLLSSGQTPLLHLTVNEEAGSVPLEPGLTVSGALDRLVTGEWMGFMAGTGAGPEAKAGPGLPLTLDMQVGEWLLGPLSLGPTRLRAKRPGDRWEISLQGERVSGRIMEQSGRFWRVELEKLKLPEEALVGEVQVPESGEVRSAAGSWPILDVTVNDLEVRGRSVDQVAFRLTSSENRLAADQLALQIDSLKFNGAMHWLLDEGRTRLDGELTGRQIKHLELLLDQKVPLQSDDARVGMTLAWPGGPQDFRLATLQGRVNMQLEDGRVMNEDNAAQLFRVFGLLNTDTLLRRLRLDFSDVVRSGVSFDNLEAKAIIKDQVLTLNPALRMEGPAGEFRLTGSTHLIEETVKMRLVVTLPLSQNLPLTALLFGVAPPVGGALFVLDKLFGTPLGRLTSAVYSVRGTWADPDIDLRNVFDTRSDLKNFEAPQLPEEAPL